MGKVFGNEGKQSSSSNTLNKIFGSGDIGKNILKLGMIATGVGAAVGILDKTLKLATESSGQFKATAKLWDTGMKLIFRPMGDIIGLVLRPFALMMIRWAIPFYQRYDTFTDEATTAGEKLMKGDIEGALEATERAMSLLISDEEYEKTKTRQEYMNTKNQENFDAWMTFFADAETNINALGDWFNKTFGLPEAHADTGDDPTGIKALGEDIDIFGGIIKRVQEEIHNRTTLEGLGIESGSDITETAMAMGHSSDRDRGFGTGGSKTMSKDTFKKLTKRMGLLQAYKHMQNRGYSLESSESSGIGGGSNPRAGSQGVTVNISGAIISDPDLGRKIQEEIQREIKKLPGRR